MSHSHAGSTVRLMLSRDTQPTTPDNIEAGADRADNRRITPLTKSARRASLIALIDGLMLLVPAATDADSTVGYTSHRRRGRRWLSAFQLRHDFVVRALAWESNHPSETAWPIESLAWGP